MRSPIIQKEGGVLAITSNSTSTILYLGSRYRRIVVDPKLRVIHIYDRRFWFFNSTRRIEFDWICEVRHTYRDVNDGPDAHIEGAYYTVGVTLMNGEAITFCSFLGDGDYIDNSGTWDWLNWDDDYAGAPVSRPKGVERQSQQLADLLCSMIGVNIGDFL